MLIRVLLVFIKLINLGVRDAIRDCTDLREARKKVIRLCYEEIKSLPRSAPERYFKWWSEVITVDAQGAMTTVRFPVIGPFIQI